MQPICTISLQTKVSRAIYLARLRSFISYLITDLDCGDYSLLESATANDTITHIYCNTTTDAPWTYDITFSQHVRRKSPVQRPLSDWLTRGYKTLFEATSMQELKWLIDRHPEVFI